MRSERPYTFNKLLQFANADIEAEPIQYDEAKRKAELQAHNKDVAKNGIR